MASRCRCGGAEQGVRFLLVSGKPLREPVAWRGPIVMNTQEELRVAFRELREGTFITSMGRKILRGDTMVRKKGNLTGK